MPNIANSHNQQSVLARTNPAEAAKGTSRYRNIPAKKAERANPTPHVIQVTRAEACRRAALIWGAGPRSRSVTPNRRELSADGAQV